MPTATRPPDIILIMTDQQRYETIAALGFRYMITPNLDRLAERGTSFGQCFSAGATCVPARAALFTGMYAHNTGTYSFNDWSHQPSWIRQLKDGGYHCVNIGKMHVMPLFDGLGFDERVVVENPTTDYAVGGGRDDDWGRQLSLSGAERPFDRHRSDPDWRGRHQGVPWHMAENLHSDVFVGDSALAWIRRRRRKGPVFLEIGFPGPHEPYDPLPRHLAAYAGRQLPKPVWRPGELEDKPVQQQVHAAFNQVTDHESTIDFTDASDDDIVEMRRHYFAKITTIDEKIGQILEALEDAGYLDDALVVFTSDHGDMLGDHRLPYKWLMYDSVVHVPLIVWDTSGRHSQLDGERLVSHLDIGPTILAAAGLAAPAWLEGQSLLDADAPRRDAVFAEDNYLTMMRTGSWKYVHYAFDEGVGELYDLEADPHELDNLFARKEYEPALQQMRLDMLNWLARSTYQTSTARNRAGPHSSVWPLMPDDGKYLHHRPKARPGAWSVNDRAKGSRP
jgi:arylsulfatase A-like enzyme